MVSTAIDAYIRIFLLAVGVLLSANAVHAAPATAPRIIGGSSVTQNSYPWMVNIEFDNALVCGGSLIASQWVLTAAHCVSDGALESYSVRVGVRDTSNTTEGEARGVDKIVAHPDFSFDTLQNDIALIKLSSPVSLQPVTLMNTTAFNQLTTGQELFVTGWGSTNIAGTTYPSLLQRATVPLVDHAECVASYATGDVIISDKMVCAGGGQTDSCFGDSGGPLIEQNNLGDTEQVGLVSFGASDQCADGFPGVYTRVDAYADFIASTTESDDSQSADPAPSTSDVAVPVSSGALDRVSFMLLLGLCVFIRSRHSIFIDRKII